MAYIYLRESTWICKVYTTYRSTVAYICIFRSSLHVYLIVPAPLDPTRQEAVIQYRQCLSFHIRGTRVIYITMKQKNIMSLDQLICCDYLGPVVQSVQGHFVNCFSRSNLQNSDIFCWKNVSSYSHFFSKKFQNICVSLDVSFKESLTKDIVSFEQLGPVIYYW